MGAPLTPEETVPETSDGEMPEASEEVTEEGTPLTSEEVGDF